MFILLSVNHSIFKKKEKEKKRKRPGLYAFQQYLFLWDMIPGVEIVYAEG